MVVVVVVAVVVVVVVVVVFFIDVARGCRVQVDPRARIPSNFAQFVGLRSC